MDKTNVPTPPIKFSDTTSLTTMENALNFVNSYLHFNNNVPQAAQIKLSAIKEIQAITSKNIENMKTLTLQLNNINNRASLQSYNILTQINALMNETKQLNEEKNRLAVEILQLVTEAASKVETTHKHSWKLRITSKKKLLKL